MADANNSIGGGDARPTPWPDTPEGALEALLRENRGSPIDLVMCVLLRAHAVTVLLSDQFTGDLGTQVQDEIVLSALWDIQGHLEVARNLVKQWGLGHG